MRDIRCLTLALATTLLGVLTACGEGDRIGKAPIAPGPGSGGEGGAGGSPAGTGGECAEDPVACACEKTTKPTTGCPCEVEGERYDCGQVYSKVGNQIVCGPGEMACGGGVWGECLLNNAPH